MEEKLTVDRRKFLQGAALTGVGAALVGLTGCASGDGGSGSSSGGAGAASNGSSAAVSGDAYGSGELIPQAYLNQQDYDYRQNTTDFATLFSSLKIGSLELNHRMVKSAAGSATYLAGLTDELYQYYVNFAKGGVELIWVEGIAELEPGEDGTLPAETIEFGKKLVAGCAEHGASLGYQWALFGGDVSELTHEEIAAFEEIGVGIAKGLKEMGFKGMEINAAGFNMGEYFLSRYHNFREDEYGKTIEGRARFVVECIEKIKAACGDDFIVQILIDAIEELDNIDNNATLMNLDDTVTSPHNLVTTVEEGIEFAKLFEAAGCDSMHLRLGPLGNHPCQFGSDLYFILNGLEGATGYGTQWDFSRHWQGELIGNHSGAGMLLDVVARYKEAVSIPCGTVTYMDPAHAPDFFEQALADGKADFYLMTRPLTVDTEYVNKLKDGRADEIAPCTRCLHCHIGSNQLNRMMGYCRTNALTQRVMTENGPATYELEPAAKVKKIMVIGGGPAGMEAARIAAARGHEVTLFEKTGVLGGQLAFASAIKGPHENLDDFKAYLEKQLEINGVSVELSTEVDAAKVEEFAPDVVILAAGGTYGSADFAEGGVPVVNFESFMSEDLGDKVVIYGANAQAFDCALWCTVHKKQVTLVTDRENDLIDAEQSQHAKRFMTSALYALGVKVLCESSIESVDDGSITVATGEGTTRVIPCDSIIVGAQFEPNTALLDEISVEESYAIGDCNLPFNIALAVRDGNDVGRAI